MPPASSTAAALAVVVTVSLTFAVHIHHGVAARAGRALHACWGKYIDPVAQRRSVLLIVDIETFQEGPSTLHVRAGAVLHHRGRAVARRAHTRIVGRRQKVPSSVFFDLSSSVIRRSTLPIRLSGSVRRIRERRRGSLRCQQARTVGMDLHRGRRFLWASVRGRRWCRAPISPPNVRHRAAMHWYYRRRRPAVRIFGLRRAPLAPRVAAWRAGVPSTSVSVSVHIPTRSSVSMNPHDRI